MRRLIVATITVALAWGTPISPTSALAAGPRDIDNNSIESVRDAYLTWLWPATKTPVDWTGDVGKCETGEPQRQPAAAVGTISTQARDAAFSALNYHREMAGLRPVTENADGSELAAQAALIMTANNRITHYPTPEMTCYSLDGADGARANLSLGARTVSGGSAGAFIDDYGPDNTDVGHRLWLLNPALSEAGYGATYNTSAFLVFGTGTAMDNQRPTDGTAWPPAGYVPWEIMPTSARWSYSAPEVDFTAASITMTRNGSAFNATITRRNGPYGDPALVWETAEITRPATDAIDTYKVTLNGIPGAPVSYEVKVFRAGIARAGSVTVTGNPTVNNRLTATAHDIVPADAFVSYTWYRNGKEVGEGSEYWIEPEDVGAALVVRARVDTLYDDWAGSTTDSASVTVKQGVIKPDEMGINGPAQVGELLSFAEGSWGAYVYCDVTLQWLRDDKPISNATAYHYRLTTADLGAKISLRATCDAPGYASATVTTAAVGPVTGTPVPQKKLTTTPVPKISGTSKVGKKLTAKAGTWKPTGVTMAYQWYRGSAKIDGATKSTYTLQGADKGKKITVKVTGSKTGYTSVTKTSTATKKVAAGTLTSAKPKITGTAKVGSTLAAKPGAWKPAQVTLTYQWYRSGKKISQATQPTYTLTSKDKGKKITVKLTGKAAGYTTASKTSAKTSKVKA